LLACLKQKRFNQYCLIKLIKFASSLGCWVHKSINQNILYLLNTTVPLVKVRIEVENVTEVVAVGRGGGMSLLTINGDTRTTILLTYAKEVVEPLVVVVVVLL